MPHPASSKKTWLPQPQLKALHASLAQAQDSQLQRLVALLDSLPDRGRLDELIAPLRSRLVKLRPERPLRFNRLLFQPLDVLVVPAMRWQPDLPTIPRTALVPLAEAVRAAIGPQCQEIDRMIAGHGSRSLPTIARAGATLWPAAAGALAGSSVPPSWQAHTGLPPARFAGLARDIGAVLAQVLPLQALEHEGAIGVPLRSEPLQAMLCRLQSDRPTALGMLLVLLLARLPQAAPLLQPVAEATGDGVMLAAIAQAKRVLLDRFEMDGGIEAMVGRAELGDVAAEVRRIVMLFSLLLADAGPAQRRRMEPLLRRLDASCITRFAAGLAAEFVHPLEALNAGAGDADIIRLEEAARGLTELSVQARAIGSRDTYAALLRQTADAVQAIRPGGALKLADRVRLVEILTGPEEAWAMLQAAATP